MCFKKVLAFSIFQHHVKELHEANLPFSICTDDKGIFMKTSSEEHEIIMELLKLDKARMFNLSLRAVDDIFADVTTKNKLRGMFQAWKNEHNIVD